MLFGIHTLPEEKLCYVCTTTSKERVFLGNYNFASSSPMRVAVPQIRIDVIGYLTPYFLINRMKSKLKGVSDCFHSHNLK